MKKVLKTPISIEDLEALKVGDIVYLDGTLVTCRDVAHRRLIEYGQELPVDLAGGAVRQAIDQQADLNLFSDVFLVRLAQGFRGHINLCGFVGGVAENCGWCFTQPRRGPLTGVSRRSHSGKEGRRRHPGPRCGCLPTYRWGRMARSLPTPVSLVVCRISTGASPIYRYL